MSQANQRCVKRIRGRISRALRRAGRAAAAGFFKTPPPPKFGIGAPNAAADDNLGRRRRESASAVNLPFAVLLISKQKSLAHKQPHHLTD